MNNIHPLLVLGFASGMAQAAFTYSFTGGTPTGGTVADGYNAGGPQIATTYMGTFTDGLGTTGIFQIDITDLSNTGSMNWHAQTNPTVSMVALPNATNGIQLVIDSNSSSQNSGGIAIEFSYGLFLGSTGSIATGAAYAVGPNGFGNQDYGGGTLTAGDFGGGPLIGGGTLYDAMMGTGTPTYDPTTGSLSLAPNPGADGQSVDHDWSIEFIGADSISSIGGSNQIDTFVFGITSIPAPEPSSATLLGFSALGLFARRKR